MSSKKKKGAVQPASIPTVKEDAPASPRIAEVVPEVGMPAAADFAIVEIDTDDLEVEAESSPEIAPEEPKLTVISRLVFDPPKARSSIEVPVPADLKVPEGSSVVASFVAPDGSRVFKFSGNRKVILPPA